MIKIKLFSGARNSVTGIKIINSNQEKINLSLILIDRLTEKLQKQIYFNSKLHKQKVLLHDEKIAIGFSKKIITLCLF